MREAPDELTDVPKLGRLFGDMVETAAWKEFEKIIQNQIAQRESLVLSPFHDMQLAGQGVQEKMIALESLKGALIGLKLALAIPSTTILHAREIAREEEEQQDAA